MAETTHTAWRRERFREQRDPFFSIFFCSIRRPHITFKLPRRDKDTPLRLCNLPDLRRLGCVTSAHMEWPVWSSSSGNNCHAVHRSLSSGASLKWDLHLVPYYQPSTPAQFLSIIGHWDVSHPLSSELQVWSSSSGNNYHAVHRSISSGASLFFYGTVRIFTLSHIVSQAVFWYCGIYNSPMRKCQLLDERFGLADKMTLNVNKKNSEKFTSHVKAQDLSEKSLVLYTLVGVIYIYIYIYKVDSVNKMNCIH